MKKSMYLLMLICAVVVNGFAQTAKPADMPQGVYKRQMGKFQGCTDMVGNVLPDGGYGVSFKLNGKTGYASYDKDGHMVNSQLEVASASLPDAVTQAVSAQYPGYKFTKVMQCKASKPDQYKEDFLKNTMEHYVLDLSKGRNTLKLYFTPDGKLIGPAK